MFYNCSSLETLDLSSFDTSSAEDMDRMFYNCTALRTVTLGEGFSFTGDGTTSCELSSPVDDEYGTGWWVDDSGNVYEDPAAPRESGHSGALPPAVVEMLAAGPRNHARGPARLWRETAGLARRRCAPPA